MGNWFKTALLMGALTALIVLMGRMMGGTQGMVLAFVLAVGMNFFSYWFSDKIVLSMYRAREVTPEEGPAVYQMVKEIAMKADLPMPRVYVIPEESPNAFATGRNPEHAVVAVTEGLLRLMDREEIMGVIAHEMAHIRNRDILIGSVAATMAGAIMIVANMARWSMFMGGGSSDEEEGGGGLFSMVGVILMSILAPLAAMLIQMAISRSREYLADATGAGFLGRADGLANALEDLGAYSKQFPMQANPSTSHMFIVNPLSGRSLASLFSTHPPLEERIARLRGQGPSSRTPSADADSDRGRQEAERAWRNLSR